MQNSKLSRLDLERKAFEKVRTAWMWIEKRAKKSEYQDSYTSGLTPTYGVMPIAEVLMCLTNTLETKYVRQGLPTADKETLNLVIRNLLDVFEQHGFSGLPYVYHPDPNAKVPEFTDAVCYVAGALVRLLPIKDLQITGREKCTELLKTCADWLLDARIEVPIAGSKIGHAWSWTKPTRGENKPFGEQTPPQTYFTTQVMITLCELLFDYYDCVANKSDQIFETLLGAKRFLLGTVAKERGKEGQGAGWCDFSLDVAKAAGFAAMEPYCRHAKLDYEEDAPRPQITLYPLEALSYIAFYGKEPSYLTTRRRLEKSLGEKVDEFFDFTKDQRLLLNDAFSLSLRLAHDKKILSRPCEIQIPEPLNGNDPNGGYLSKEGTGQMSHYLDGTVAFNVLNALNFYIRYFEEDETNRANFQEWRNLEIDFVDMILEESFTGNAFKHSTPVRTKSAQKEVIYATRSAIASLLSWGVAPSLEVSQELRSLVHRLYALVEGQEPVPTAVRDIDGSSEVLNDTVQVLVRVAFVFGQNLARLIDMPEKATGWNKWLDLDAKVEGRKADIDKGAIARINGKELTQNVSKLLAGDQSDVESVLRWMEQSTFLVKVYREAFLERRKALLAADAGSRIQLVQAIVKDIVSQSPSSELQDIYGK